MATPHDSLFKLVFSQPHHAAGELRRLLPPRLAAAARWDTLELLPGSFTDPAEPDRHVDLLYRVELGSRPALLHVILEHKSTADRWTALQVLEYATRVLAEHRRRHPTLTRLPPVVAIVVYHGPHGWNRATGTRELFDVDPSLHTDIERFLPRLDFLLDDLSLATDRSLTARTGTALAHLTLLCLQLVRDGAPLRDVLRRLRDAVLDARDAPDTGAALISVLTYIAQVRDLSGAELRDLVLTEIGPELEPDMTSTYDQLLNQGRTEGRAEGRAEILLEQLTRRFGPPSAELVERVHTADADALRRWATRVLDATSLDDVLADD
ncbi:MAG: Rpn family recombination-promoting nuclease/putative transposase [Planctomycetes bacterium]|nr:Rpn family recombination-promoting nuclease/putative transposase [Planctomycetota bacterium]